MCFKFVRIIVAPLYSDKPKILPMYIKIPRPGCQLSENWEEMSVGKT